MPAGDVSILARYQGGKDPVSVINNKATHQENFAFDPFDYTIRVLRPFGNIKIEVFSIDGRRVLIKQIQQESGTDFIKLPLGRLNAGNYILKTTIDGNETVNSFRYLN